MAQATWGPCRGAHARSRAANFASLHLVAIESRYSSQVGQVIVRLAAASRVAASTTSGFSSKRSQRNSSGDRTVTPRAWRAWASKCFRLSVTNTHGAMATAAEATWRSFASVSPASRAGSKSGNQRVGEPGADERERTRFDTLPRPRLHVTQPFLFDHRAPLGVKQIILRHLQEQIAQMVRIEDVGVKKRSYRVRHSSLRDLPYRRTMLPQKNVADPRIA